MIRSVGLVALGAALAGLGFFAWQQLFSREAELRAIHAACLKEVADANAKLKGGIERGTPGVAKEVGEGVTRWLDGAVGSMSESLCGTVRDACASNFDGRICTAARERYR